MSSWVIVVVAVLAACALIAMVQAWRDVRVARWTRTDPRVDRDAQREAARQVRGQEGQG